MAAGVLGRTQHRRDPVAVTSRRRIAPIIGKHDASCRRLTCPRCKRKTTIRPIIIIIRAINSKLGRHICSMAGPRHALTLKSIAIGQGKGHRIMKYAAIVGMQVDMTAYVCSISHVC